MAVFICRKKYHFKSENKTKGDKNFNLSMMKTKENKTMKNKTNRINLICKVGDTIWDIADGYLEPCKVTAFSYGECEGYIEHPVVFDEIVFYYIKPRSGLTGSFAASEIGNTLLLTKEEAEKKLEEIFEEKWKIFI